MAVLTTEFQNELKPVIRKVTDTTEKEAPKYYAQVFNVLTTSDAYEEDLKVAGLPAAQRKEEGAPVKFYDLVRLWTYRYTVVTMAIGTTISEEALEDIKVDVIRGPARRLARALLQAKEQHHWNIFNTGFTTTYGDGQFLFDNDHPIVGASAASNVLSTPSDLSVSSLQDAIRLLRWTTDDRGFPYECQPETLIVAPDNALLAYELCDTLKKPQTADNDDNVAKTRFGITPLVCPYLTDADAWFLVTSKANHQLNSFTRKAPTYPTVADEVHGLMRFLAKERYIAGASDWRGLVGTPGA